jgi:hypothetical protein
MKRVVPSFYTVEDLLLGHGKDGFVSVPTEKIKLQYKLGWNDSLLIYTRASQVPVNVENGSQ